MNDLSDNFYNTIQNHDDQINSPIDFSHDHLNMDVHNFSAASDSDNNFYHEHYCKQESPRGAINVPSDFNAYTENQSMQSDSNSNKLDSTDNSTDDSSD